MEAKAHTPQFLQKRKFFLVLPLLVLPFFTLLFWALGGGKVTDAYAGQPTANGSLNMELPDAHLKDDKSLNKLSYYEKAASDSAKLEELMKNDPYYRQNHPTEIDGLVASSDTLQTTMYKQNGSGAKNELKTSQNSSPVYTDPNEAKVYQKINELNTALSQATVQSDKSNSNTEITHNKTESINSADIDRLAQMIDKTKGGDGNEDPEMNQLNGMMDKILDIQHPERVKERIKQTSESNEGQVFAVTANNGTAPISLMTTSKGTALNETLNNNQPSANGFFSIDDEEYNTGQQNSIQAVIHETQTVVEGSNVKLRLVNDVYINGTLIPKNNFVFGTASLIGERLNIIINSVRYRNSLFPVQLAVVDMDGIDGIYIPGSITREVVKGSGERAVQGIDFNTLNHSIGAQAASAGIEAAKTLLSRKSKLIKVMVKAGYQVLLRDEKQKTSF